MFAPKTRTFMPLAFLAAVAITCLQGAAFAGEVPMEPTNRVVQLSTRGLNLASPADVDKLDARIRKAASQVCRPESFRDVRALSDRPACEKTAIAQATSRLNVLVARAQAEQLASQTQSAPGVN